MPFRLLFSLEAKLALENLEQVDQKKYQKVLKTLALMEINLPRPSLNTHKYESLAGANGEEVSEAYVENKTPAVFRVFWYYGPTREVITIVAVTPHP